MVGKIKKTAAALLAAFTCVPLAACAATETDEVVKSVAGENVSSVAETVADDGAEVKTEREAATASVWTATLADAGWDEPNTSGGNAYDGFVVDETEKTVTISSANALAYFAHEVYARGDGFSGYTVSLKCDVDLNNRLWFPIGFDHRKQDSKSLPHAFKGTFDGNGHTVYNFGAEKFLKAITATGSDIEHYEYAVVDGAVSVPLYSEHEHRDNDANWHFYEFHYGFFGATGNATVKNLNIDTFEFDFKSILEDETADSKVKLLIPDSVAALIGYAGGGITVENCTVGNPDTESLIVGADTSAGIVGRAYPGYLQKTSPNGKDKFDKNTGVKMPMLVRNCTSYVNLGCMNEERSSAGTKKGSMVAYAYWLDKVEFINCKNYGDIYGSYVGGMISYTQDGDVNMTIKNCENYGNIYQYIQGNEEVFTYAGGIAGRLYSYSPSPKSFSMTNCINRGNIVCDNAYGAGGICGQLYMNSNNDTAKNEFVGCYNYGDVTVNNATVKNTSNNDIPSLCGGVVGDLSFYGAEKATVGVGNVGKVAGGGTVNGCFGNGNGKGVGSYTTLYLINGYEL